MTEDIISRLLLCRHEPGGLVDDAIRVIRDLQAHNDRLTKQVAEHEEHLKSISEKMDVHIAAQAATLQLIESMDKHLTGNR